MQPFKICEGRPVSCDVILISSTMYCDLAGPSIREAWEVVELTRKTVDSASHIPCLTRMDLIVSF